MVAGNVVEANTVLIAAGGTAGHILPSVDIARALIQQGAAVLFLGDKKALSALPADLKLTQHELTVKSPRTLTRLLSWLFYQQIATALYRTISIFYSRKFKAVLVTGGIIGLLPGVLALITRTPLIIYEQNVVLGAANKMLLWLGAKQVLYGLPPLKNHMKVRFIGQPLRAEILQAQRPKKAAPLKKILLIIGGSLGSGFFNKQLPQYLSQISALHCWRIIHLAGPHACCKSIAGLYHNIDYQILSYADNIAALYNVADCVIARAGALTLSELCYLSIPAVIIPLPNAAGDHQRYNAAAMANLSACSVLQESELTAAALEKMIYTALIKGLYQTQELRPSFFINAAKEISKECLT